MVKSDICNEPDRPDLVKFAFVINQIDKIWSKVPFVINQIDRIKSGIDIYPNQIGYI